MVSLNDVLRNILADELGDDMDDGALNVYDEGSDIPADANAAITDQTLLAAVALPADAFNAASGGTITKNGTWDDQDIDATGTAAFYRLTDASGTAVAQGIITATGGGGDMEVDDVNFIAGGVFTVTSFSLTLPAS